MKLKIVFQRNEYGTWNKSFIFYFLLRRINSLANHGALNHNFTGDTSLTLIYKQQYLMPSHYHSNLLQHVRPLKAIHHQLSIYGEERQNWKKVNTFLFYAPTGFSLDQHVKTSWIICLHKDKQNSLCQTQKHWPICENQLYSVSNIKAVNRKMSLDLHCDWWDSSEKIEVRLTLHV